MPTGSPTDVLVVGAGPTGLTMASELRRHGVTCRLVDRERERHRESRATDLQARTLEVFDDMGLVDGVLAAGAPRKAVSIFAGGKRVVRLGFEGADTPYCGVVGLAQYDTERLLQEHLERQGGAVERGVELALLSQDDGGVEATLLYADGSWRRERFGWVVGCDGAHSAVRHALGFAFEGHTFKESFFLADATVEWDIPGDEMSIFSSSHGMVATINMPGQHRMRIFGDLDLGDEPRLDLETCQGLLTARAGTKARLSDLGWTAAFHVHSRMVGEYRRGRVFLAGDAAHIHSPVGGHGLNYGVQDAYNLAWKLALVVRGYAAPTLLDSYHLERHPPARALLDDTDLETRMALWRSTTAQQLAGALFKVVGGLPPLRRRFLTDQMELGIDYGKGPLCAEHQSSMMSAHLTHPRDSEDASVADHYAFSHGPPAGLRAPDVRFGGDPARRLFDLLRGPRHTLLLFDGRSATAEGYRNLATIAEQVGRRWGDLVRAHIVVPRAERPDPLPAEIAVELDPDEALHRRYGASAESLYLIRPDGYVGFRSQPADGDALIAHLGRYLS